MSQHCKTFLILLLTTAAISSYGQLLTLDSAYQLARNNYPLIQQRDLINQTKLLNIDNLGKGYLPQVNISGQGTYQSDVTKVDIKVPGVTINPLSQDQYKVVADINQMIYDGGVIKEQQKIQELNATTEANKLEVELYKLKDRINQLYLGILLTDQQVQQVQLLQADIQNGINKVQAQVNNGVAFRSNLNSLKAELLKTEQRLLELTTLRESLVAVLGVFTGKTLPANIQLQQPTAPAINNTINRPELNLYAAQSKLVGHQYELLKAKNRPKASAFVQGGYGRPGLNMLKNEFAWFYVGGIRISWSLGNLYSYKNEKKLIDINKRTVDIQQQTFELNTNTQLTQQLAEVNKYEKLVKTDLEIIDLRKSVKEAALAQLENGVITSNDYLREVTAEDQARVSMITHQLQLLQAKINYQTIAGK